MAFVNQAEFDLRAMARRFIDLADLLTKEAAELLDRADKISETENSADVRAPETSKSDGHG
jgi:hypothetical protein